jgi:hypothetical protein
VSREGEGVREGAKRRQEKIEFLGSVLHIVMKLRKRGAVRDTQPRFEGF